MKVHLWRLYRRLHVDNGASALAAARERGLLAPDGAGERAAVLAGGA